jgi:hypothetical protein
MEAADIAITWGTAELQMGLDLLDSMFWAI